MENFKNLALVGYPLAEGFGMSVPQFGGMKLRGDAWITAPVAPKPQGITLSAGAHVAREVQISVDEQLTTDRPCTSVPVDRSP